MWLEVRSASGRELQKKNLTKLSEWAKKLADELQCQEVQGYSPGEKYSQLYAQKAGF